MRTEKVSLRTLNLMDRLIHLANTGAPEKVYRSMLSVLFWSCAIVT